MNFVHVLILAVSLPASIATEGFQMLSGDSFFPKNNSGLSVIASDSVGPHTFTLNYRNLHLMKNLTFTLRKVLEEYDQQLRPDFFGPPIQVKVSFHIEGIVQISEVDMEFKVDFYLRQSWVDTRLKFEVDVPIKFVPLTNEFGQRIWYPDTFFQNEKDSFVHSATVTNGFFRWHPSGRILKSTRMTLTASCPMNLENFPMDQQICSILVGSYGLPDTDLSYDWDTEASSVHFGPDSRRLLQHFQLVGYRQRKLVAEFATGNYTTLACDFLLTRSLSYYLIEVFIPSALVVIISWFAFWMGRDAAVERMTLGVTSVLTITTLLLSTHSNSPKISYVKAIDVYVGICFFMVFASLLQSAMIGYFLKKVRDTGRLTGMDKDHQPIYSVQSDSATSPSDLTVPPPEVSSEVRVLRRKKHKEIPLSRARKKITQCDVMSRYVFPCSFILFNACYWVYYLNASAVDEDPDWINNIKTGTGDRK